MPPQVDDEHFFGGILRISGTLMILICPKHVDPSVSYRWLCLPP